MRSHICNLSILWESLLPDGCDGMESGERHRAEAGFSIAMLRGSHNGVKRSEEGDNLPF